MSDQLTEDEKLRLLRFVCSFAWADLEIAEKERDFVRDLAQKMALSDEANEQVLSWLDHPPSEEELDPFEVPAAHRKLILEAVLEMVAADGIVDMMEVESFAIFEALMGGGEDEGDSPAP